MATRSSITAKNSLGETKTIYCHFDGYYEGVGRMLVENYTDPEKIAKLIDLGSISILEAKVEPDPENPHSFDNPQKGVIVAYHRDRGDKKEYLSQKEGKSYTFIENEWYVGASQYRAHEDGYLFLWGHHYMKVKNVLRKD
jgi:hypothetical protein